MSAVTLEQVASVYATLSAAMRSGLRAPMAGPVFSQRKGFGSLARQYGMIRTAPTAKISKAGKKKARAQAKNRESHRKGGAQ